MFQHLFRIIILSILFVFLNCPVLIGQKDKLTQKKLIKVLEDESTLSILPFYHYLENSIGGEDTKFPFALDAHISPHFYMFNEGSDHPFGKNILIDINPQVDVRIFRIQESVPVRTASYKPAAKLHWLQDINLFGGIKIRNLYVGYLHHSNGQDGNSIAALAANDIRDEYEYINDSHHFNVYNGDFSLNFIPVGFDIAFYKRRNALKPNSSWLKLVNDEETGNSKFAFCSTNYLLRVNYNIHVGNPKTPLDGYYSFYRPSITFKMARNVVSSGADINETLIERELDRFNVFLSWGFGKMDLIENFNTLTRLNARITYHVRLPLSSNIAIMAQAGFNGSDSYNIYLEDKNLYFKLGISTGSFLYNESI